MNNIILSIIAIVAFLCYKKFNVLQQVQHTIRAIKHGKITHEGFSDTLDVSNSRDGVYRGYSFGGQCQNNKYWDCMESLHDEEKCAKYGDYNCTEIETIQTNRNVDCTTDCQEQINVPPFTPPVKKAYYQKLVPSSEYPFAIPGLTPGYDPSGKIPSDELPTSQYAPKHYV